MIHNPACSIARWQAADAAVGASDEDFTLLGRYTVVLHSARMDSIAV